MRQRTTEGLATTRRSALRVGGATTGLRPPPAPPLVRPYYPYCRHLLTIGPGSRRLLPLSVRTVATASGHSTNRPSPDCRAGARYARTRLGPQGRNSPLRLFLRRMRPPLFLALAGFLSGEAWRPWSPTVGEFLGRFTPHYALPSGSLRERPLGAGHRRNTFWQWDEAPNITIQHAIRTPCCLRTICLTTYPRLACNRISYRCKWAPPTHTYSVR